VALPAKEHTYCLGKGYDNHELGRGFSVHKRIISSVKRVKYIILRGHWYHIIVLKAHAPTEDKIKNVKDNFYKELECVFDKFPKYRVKILLGDFTA
jgi:hypothetical protein